MTRWLPYDKKFFFQTLFGLVGLAVAMRLTGGHAFLAIFPFIFAAFSANKTEMLFALLLTLVAFTVSNSQLIPKAASFSIAIRLAHVLIAGVMVMQLVGQRNTPLVRPLLSIFFYLAYMAIVSASGWMPLISYLKLLLFTIIFLSYYSVTNASATRWRVDVRKLRSAMLAFCAFFVFGSFVVWIFFPSAAYFDISRAIQAGRYVSAEDLAGGNLFMGITMHSQTMGPIAASIGTLLLADLLFSIRRWDKFYLAILFCVPILIYKTASRTAMGTLLAGVFFVFFLFMQAHGVGARWKTRAMSALTLLGVLGGMVLFSTPQMRNSVMRFVQKWHSDDDPVAELSLDDVLATRQGLMDSAMDNFRESPLIGNGFQVSRELGMVEITSWQQLLSAPVEKGVWITAVLEEGGVFGMLLFVIFLLVVIGTFWKRRAYAGLAAFIVLTIANLGEFTFFSLSGLGGFFWAMVFAGLVLDAQRLREEQMGYVMAWRPPPPTAAPYSVALGGTY